MLIPDMDQALGEMRGLVELACLRRIDLFVYLRELTDLGAPFLRADIDASRTAGTSDQIVHYKLDNGLKALLLALRAGNFHADEVERGSGRERSPRHPDSAA
jgi:hypothetical protein